MSQTPITVTYSLEEILGQINQKLDKIDDRFDSLDKDITEIKIGQTRLEGKIEKLETDLNGKIDKLEIEVKGKIEKLETDLNGKIDKLEIEVKGEIKTLSTEVKGIGKRLDTQEFINRSVVVGFVLGITTGIIKLFFPNFPN
ncbi:MAG: Bdr protein [Crocosphaera sp.]